MTTPLLAPLHHRCPDTGLAALCDQFDGALGDAPLCCSFQSAPRRPRPEPLCPPVTPPSESPRDRQSPLPSLSPTAEVASPCGRSVLHFRRSGSCPRLGRIGHTPTAFSLQRAGSSRFQVRRSSPSAGEPADGVAAVPRGTCVGGSPLRALRGLPLPDPETSSCGLSEAVSRESSALAFSPQQRRPREVRFQIPADAEAQPRASSMSPRGLAASPHGTLRSGTSADSPHPSPKMRLCGSAAAGLRLAKHRAPAT
eukprot:EG_transcript_13061